MFLENIHNFRTVAIIGIVGAHSLHNFDWADKPLQFSIFDSLFNQSSIWFFFIAGFLFHHLSDRYETKKYYISKIKNVVIPYIILSIPAIYVSIAFIPQDMPAGFYDKPVAVQIILFLITGKQLAPFWFVPTITLIYLLSPLLIIADRAKWPYLFCLPLLALSAVLGRDGFLELTKLGGYYSPISKAIYLFSIYFFGMLCSRYKDYILQTAPFTQWPLLLVGLGAYTIDVLDINNSVHFIFIFKACISVLLIHYLEIFGRNNLRKLSYLGHASFGVFFVHGYFLAIMKMVNTYLWSEPLFPANMFAYFAFIIAITLISCASLYLAQKILGPKSRLIVGA